jgi:hypothetical protein
MRSFIGWLTDEALKRKRKKNGEQHSNQGSGEVGNDNYQGQIDRTNQEIQSNNIHIFPEP